MWDDGLILQPQIDSKNIVKKRKKLKLNDALNTLPFKFNNIERKQKGLSK